MENVAKDYSKTNESTIQDKCICLSVEFRTYGTSRKVNMDKVTVDADKDRLHISKHILDSDNMEAIHKIYRNTYNWLWTKCLPAPLRKGMYLLPIELVAEVDAKLKNAEEEIRPFIQALKVELPELKEADRRELRSQFSESDYPTEQEIENAFYIDSKYIDFRVPEKLKSIGANLYNKEVEKQARGWEEAAENAREFLRETAQYLIEQFANQLKIEKEGKKGEKRGRIYDSTIESLKRFAEDFAARNIAGDDKLLTLVAKVKNAIDGIDADALRGNDRLRSKLADEIEQVRGNVRDLMARPIRAIELE
jgi:hypothetical protein